ncbi:unnamed protein product [Amoebophrya sp. A25]|nr:unnamed protein product [Amoebophrya sp. A25]|eukprot:GSA25T00020898001.1
MKLRILLPRPSRGRRRRGHSTHLRATRIYRTIVQQRQNIELQRTSIFLSKIQESLPLPYHLFINRIMKLLNLKWLTKTRDALSQCCATDSA